MTETSPLGADARDDRRGWYVVAVLILAYTVSYIDRQILTLLVEPIKAALHVSDVAISMVHGLAFAIFYTLLGLPIGRLVDRHRRVGIIGAGIMAWSVMTALCGLTRNFGQLFLARVGVGIGEAALSPAAYSMLADCFSPRVLPRALSAYTGAIYIGAGLALVAGGALIGAVPALDLPWVGHLAPWQVVFLVVAAPGPLVAALVAGLGEPPRHGMHAETAGAPDLGQVVAHVGANRGVYLPIMLGFSASSLMWNGATAWIATYFIRQFHWSPATIGLRFGLMLLVIGTAGIMVGGFLAGRWRAAGRLDANLLIGIVSAALALPFAVLAPFAGDSGLALALFGGFVFGAAMPYGCAAGAIQDITPNRMRGQISALYLLFINLAGIGLGPMIMAAINEHWLGGGAHIGLALAITAVGAAPLCILLLLLARKPYRALLAAQSRAPA